MNDELIRFKRLPLLWMGGLGVMRSGSRDLHGIIHQRMTTTTTTNYRRRHIIPFDDLDSGRTIPMLNAYRKPREFHGRDF